MFFFLICPLRVQLTSPSESAVALETIQYPMERSSRILLNQGFELQQEMAAVIIEKRFWPIKFEYFLSKALCYKSAALSNGTCVDSLCVVIWLVSKVDTWKWHLRKWFVLSSGHAGSMPRPSCLPTSASISNNISCLWDLKPTYGVCNIQHKCLTVLSVQKNIVHIKSFLSRTGYISVV